MSNYAWKLELDPYSATTTAGKIPEISCYKKLLPLDLLFFIELDLDPHIITNNTLVFCWCIQNDNQDDDNILIKTSPIKITDSDFKQKLEHHPEIKEKILSFIKGAIEVTARGMNLFETRLNFENKLAENVLNTELANMVNQTKIWRKFFKPFDGVFDLDDTAIINESGWYVLWTKSIMFRSQPVYDDGSTFETFDFDPQTHPPTIEENDVLWELPEKIIVILPHEKSDKETAERYGYLDLFLDFQKAEEKRKQEEKEGGQEFYLQKKERKDDDVQEKLTELRDILS